jgi:Na+-transporting methylmalonyl-CoA/oxaloacetate decarboxylase gamma subunit
MFLQQAPAETFNYMVLGFSVILSVLILYIISIVVRFRALKRDINLLEEVEVEKDSKI